MNSWCMGRACGDTGERSVPDPQWKRDADLTADESAAERYLGCGKQQPEAGF